MRRWERRDLQRVTNRTKFYFSTCYADARCRAQAVWMQWLNKLYIYFAAHAKLAVWSASYTTTLGPLNSEFECRTKNTSKITQPHKKKSAFWNVFSWPVSVKPALGVILLVSSSWGERNLTLTEKAKTNTCDYHAVCSPLDPEGEKEADRKERPAGHRKNRRHLRMSKVQASTLTFEISLECCS